MTADAPRAGMRIDPDLYKPPSKHDLPWVRYVSFAQFCDEVRDHAEGFPPSERLHVYRANGLRLVLPQVSCATCNPPIDWEKVCSGGSLFGVNASSGLWSNR